MMSAHKAVRSRTAFAACEVDHTDQPQRRVEDCSLPRSTGAWEMSNQWKPNLLTLLVIAALVLAYAHSYGYL
jgi:hypothetical protein